MNYDDRTPLAEPGSTTTPEILVYTLGQFEVVKDGRPLEWGPKTPRRQIQLLQAIIALGHRSVSVERVGDALWPDAHATRSLVDVTLLRLRSLLGGRDFVTTRGGQLALNAERCWVDTWAFEHAAERVQQVVRAPSPSSVRSLDEALSLYRGDFLEDQGDEPWAAPRRSRLRRAFRRVVAAAASHRRSVGASTEQIAEVYDRGRELIPDAEEFYRELMCCYHALGRRAEALQLYHECCAKLQEFLGGHPSPETEAVYARLRAGASLRA